MCLSADGSYVSVGQTWGENSNSFTDTEAKQRNALFYKVMGANKNGYGLYSPYAAVAPPSPELLAWLNRPPFDPAAPPESVPGLSGENVKRNVTLSWKVARRGWTYDVLRGPSETGPFIPVATGLDRTQWSQGGLDFGRHYFYAVAAVGRGGTRGPQSAPLGFSPVDDTIPAPWKGTDVGDVGAEGSDGLLGGVFTLHASGGDAWGPADAFHSVSQTLNGDGTIIAHVAEQEDTSEWAKAGLMIRETAEPGAKNVFVFAAPGHGVVLQTRTAAGGGTGGTADRTGLSGTPWLKLTRAGDTFTGWASRDGQAWTEIGTANVPMPKTVLIGLASLSHARGSLSRTRFDGVSLSP